MNLFNLEKVFITKKERGWKTLYVAVDAHGTMTKPYHDRVEFYPGCIEVMKWFNSRPDFSVILWTSSHPQEIKEIIDEAHSFGFHFDFINRNPLEKSSRRANFDQKFYFNILLDDKAGFDPETDWFAIKAELQRIGEWMSLDKIEKVEYNNPMKNRAIYIGPTVDQTDLFINYGMTGVVQEVKGVTDGTNFIFEVDGSTTHFLTPKNTIHLAE